MLQKIYEKKKRGTIYFEFQKEERELKKNERAGERKEIM